MAHRKKVHWQTEPPSFSDLNSLCFDDTSEVSAISTSSLEYVNSQLVAHGFVPPPGLSLDGVSNDDSARLIKCLLSLLGQRMDDMSRTEDLTAKYRTISYDLERMRSLHRSETEKAANAEREVNMHKSKLLASVKSLQALEISHKHTTTELQRTRTLLQGVRATHVTELKRKDKDMERIMEKWQKVSEQQSKFSATSSGMKCLNVEAVEGANFGRGQGFLDLALEDSERARSHLTDENLYLRKLVLRTANQLQDMIHQARSLPCVDLESQEPTPLIMATLFPLAPASAASDKIDEVITSFQDTLSTLSTSQAAPTAPLPPTSRPNATSVSNEEVERLEGVIAKLKKELAQSQTKALSQANETQAMFDKFAKDHRLATGEIGEMSMELMAAPLKDEEKMRLEDLRQELDRERQNFTQAAIKFGKEKAALEAERIRFMDEKRTWEVDRMLSYLPPTPVPESPPRSKHLKLASPAKATRKSPMKSPRKSPIKQKAVGKSGSGRKAHRVSRLSLASPSKVISYETELMPPLAAPAFPPIKPLPSLASSLLPTSFVLPPPSPRASLPTKPALPLAPLASTSLNDEDKNLYAGLAPTVEISPPPEDREVQQGVGPSTPPAARRPFPVAKPFAQKMFHAYSPARPSPLSRILMLNDSPPILPLEEDTSPSPRSGALEGDSGDSFERAVMGIPSTGHPQEPMSLAAELGVSESPPDTPLQEKKVPPIGKGTQVSQLNVNRKAKESIRSGTLDKGKAKADSRPRSKVAGMKEKENSSKRVVGSKAGASTTSGLNIRKVSPPITKPTSKPANSIKPPPTTKPATVFKPPIAGGPRRVLINSAEAPVIGKSRKE